MRYHSIYGVYGISVFAVRDATIDELADGTGASTVSTHSARLLTRG